MKLVALAVIVLASLATFAHADGKPMRQALLERFDRNHDGRLEPRERRAAARQLRKLADKLERRRDDRARGKARMHAMVDRYDLNGDGDVGPGEVPPNVAKRLRRLDRNRDGWIDEGELQSP